MAEVSGPAAGSSRPARRGVVKPTPPELLHDLGDGLNFATRPTELPGYLTPIDRFYIRNHGATPRIDVHGWRLRVDGSGVRRPVEFSYDELLAMPHTSVIRAIECAGNGRVFFAENLGRPARGTPWRTGAIGVAEWTGVRLAELLDRAGLTPGARDVMPEGLDEPRIDRPMPLAKARADDTLLALAMNGRPLPPDHGYPARVVVPGWLGTASIKWVGRIQVAEEPLYSYWNTHDYVLSGPDYAPVGPADGPPVTTMPPMSMLELDWPAVLPAGPHTVRGRAFSGEGRVSRVEYAVDDAAWAPARLTEPNITGAWVRFELPWTASPGQHTIRTRTTDAQGHTQPDTVPWNEHGCLYHASVAHPVTV